MTDAGVRFMPAFALLLPTAAATRAFKDASFSAADSSLPTRLAASWRGARIGDALPRSMLASSHLPREDQGNGGRVLDIVVLKKEAFLPVTFRYIAVK